MSADECDNFLIVESEKTQRLDLLMLRVAIELNYGPHSIEDVTDVIATLSGIGKSPIWSHVLFKTINTPSSPRDLWSTGLLIRESVR